jgi:hypothetical protein
MYKGIQMSATVRKNFVFSEEIAMHLEEMAKENGQSMTSFVEDMIEEKYGSKKVSKRLEAFRRSIEIGESMGSGLFKDKSIQSIKADMDV